MKRVLAGEPAVALLLRQPPIKLAPPQCHPVRPGLRIAAHDPFRPSPPLFYPLIPRDIGASRPSGA